MTLQEYYNNNLKGKKIQYFPSLKIVEYPLDGNPNDYLKHEPCGKSWKIVLKSQYRDIIDESSDGLRSSKPTTVIDNVGSWCDCSLIEAIKDGYAVIEVIEWGDNRLECNPFFNICDDGVFICIDEQIKISITEFGTAFGTGLSKGWAVKVIVF